MPAIWEPGREDPYGNTVNTTRGNFVALPDIRPDPDLNEANAFLSLSSTHDFSLRSGPGQAPSGDPKLWLWVTEVDIDFSISVTVMQSRTRRSMFPHHIVTPSIRISGQMPNTAEFNRLALFAAASHSAALRSEKAKTTFKLVGKGVPQRNTKEIGAPRHKGTHEQISVQGYIKSIQAGAERFVNAPPFSFEFAIFKANKLLGFSDKDVSPEQMKGLVPVRVVHSLTQGRDFVTIKEVATANDKSNKNSGSKSPDHTAGTQPTSNGPAVATP